MIDANITSSETHIFNKGHSLANRYLEPIPQIIHYHESLRASHTEQNNPRNMIRDGDDSSRNRSERVHQ